jgi:DNA-binding transcriptional regulator PaaX
MILDLETADKLINGMVADPRLRPSAFRVGVWLIVHMARSTSPVADPSLAEIAHMLSISERYLRTCLADLRDAGWLTWARPNRQLTNEYRFDLAKIGGEPRA